MAKSMNLSEMASAVRRIRGGADEMAGDPIGAYYGVSGMAAACGARYEAKELKALFERSGWTLDEYNEELEARTSGRFAYFNHLLVHEEDLEVRTYRAW